ncbi:MAG: type II toxin-antitoxin system VapC family toxin [Candidatus Hydrothermarchaeaceae archaeon]
MSSVLVDTDIIVDHLRGMEGADRLLKKIEKKELEGYFSTITEAELFAGKGMDSREARQRVAALLSIMKRIPVNSSIARKAGEIKRSSHIPLPDAIIAASAMTIKASLATRNVRHFKGVEKLGLERA